MFRCSTGRWSGCGRGRREWPTRRGRGGLRGGCGGTCVGSDASGSPRRSTHRGERDAWADRGRQLMVGVTAPEAFTPGRLPAERDEEVTEPASWPACAAAVCTVGFWASEVAASEAACTGLTAGVAGGLGVRIFCRGGDVGCWCEGARGEHGRGRGGFVGLHHGCRPHVHRAIGGLRGLGGAVECATGRVRGCLRGLHRGDLGRAGHRQRRHRVCGRAGRGLGAHRDRRDGGAFRPHAEFGELGGHDGPVAALQAEAEFRDHAGGSDGGVRICRAERRPRDGGRVNGAPCAPACSAVELTGAVRGSHTTPVIPTVMSSPCVGGACFSAV